MSATRAIAGASAAAWVAVLAATVLGADSVASHDALLGGGRVPSAVAVLAFLASWQLMTAAMMMPTSAPMIGLFARASRGQEHPALARTAFLGAYFAVWSGFAVAALAGDAGVHALVDRWTWLAERPTLISGSVLALGGAFQFSSLKRRCLDACRSPLQFLWLHYRRGVGSAWRLGLHHGLFCLGCCWALMLVLFAVGVGSIVWMTVLGAVMLVEKTVRGGERIAPVVGAVLLALAVPLLVLPFAS